MIDHLEASHTTAKTIPHRFSMFPHSPGYEVQWRDVDPEASISLVSLPMTDAWKWNFFLPTWMVEFDGTVNVCNYTSPMDSMGNYGKRKNWVETCDSELRWLKIWKKNAHPWKRNNIFPENEWLRKMKCPFEMVSFSRTFFHFRGYTFFIEGKGWGLEPSYAFSPLTTPKIDETPYTDAIRWAPTTGVK